jgi:hypothetical protein
MERFGRIMLLTFGLGLTAVALSFFPRRPIAAAPNPPAIPVNVENTPTVSAKQSGVWNVGVTGTPTVNAAQSGAWSVGITGTVPVSGNVGITGTPNVTVTNTTPLSVTATGDPANAAFAPVQEPLAGTVGPFTGGICTLPTYTVPMGSRLVIEVVTGRAVLGTGEKLDYFSIDTISGGLSVSHGVAPTSEIDDGTVAAFAGTQAMRLYADPGSTVAIYAIASSASDTGSCVNSFSGYLVPST